MCNTLLSHYCWLCEPRLDAVEVQTSCFNLIYDNKGFFFLFDSNSFQIQWHTWHQFQTFKYLTDVEIVNK